MTVVCFLTELHIADNHDKRTLDISIRRSPTSRVLATPAEVNEASEAGIPIVCRTSIRHPGRPSVRCESSNGRPPSRHAV